MTEIELCSRLLDVLWIVSCYHWALCVTWVWLEKQDQSCFDPRMVNHADCLCVTQPDFSILFILFVSGSLFQFIITLLCYICLKRESFVILVHIWSYISRGTGGRHLNHLLPPSWVVLGWVGGPHNFRVTWVSIGLWFSDCFGVGFGLRELDFGFWLDDTTGTVLLWACFWTNWVKKGLFLTPRLSTKYF